MGPPRERGGESCSVEVDGASVVGGFAGLVAADARRVAILEASRGGDGVAVVADVHDVTKVVVGIRVGRLDVGPLGAGVAALSLYPRNSSRILRLEAAAELATTAKLSERKSEGKRGDTRAAHPLGAFKQLYAIERSIRDLPLEQRQAERRDRSRPLYDTLVRWCEGYQPYEPPASPMGRAVRYLLNHRDALRRFLEDGAIPIDNRVVERLHVRTALTRKNFLFVGSHQGGHRAAIVYTILACCSLAEVDPVQYLADVLPRLGGRQRTADQALLMSAQWKARRGHVDRELLQDVIDADTQAG